MHDILFGVTLSIPWRSQLMEHFMAERIVVARSVSYPRALSLHRGFHGPELCRCHAYNGYENFNLPHVSKPYSEFPKKTGVVHNGSSPGSDRVVIESIASDYSTAVYSSIESFIEQAQKRGPIGSNFSSLS